MEKTMNLYEQIIHLSGEQSLSNDLLQNAVVVNMNNVADFLLKTNRGINHLLADRPILTPPFPVMWFEYKSVSLETETLLGFLTHRIKNNETQSIIVTEFRQSVGNQKGIDLGQGCSILHKYLVDLNMAGTLLNVDAKYQLAALVNRGLAPGSIGQLNVVLTAFSILNCLNSSLETVSMMGIKPVHTIAINTNLTQADEESRRQTTEIRPGHQKDFRAGEGLFGKHHGIYWWNN